MERDAERARAVLQDVEQTLAADADEAVARRALTVAVDMDLDIVPMGESPPDGVRRSRDRSHRGFERLVREDDAPAERVVGPVALEHDDLVAGIAQLHRDREIEPGGSAAEARDAHISCRVSGGPKGLRYSISLLEVPRIAKDVADRRFPSWQAYS